MRSVDLTGTARIRHAALARFGTDGYAATSMRTIAADAGVSPALIVHHFGSKEGLRQACDDHVFAFFEALLDRVAQNDPAQSMAQFEGFTDESMALTRYLMRQASEDSPRANTFVARIVELTKQSLATQTRKGFVRPTEDPDMRAAVLVMLRLGPLLFAGAMAEATGADVLHPEGLRRMYRSTLELLTHGFYTTDPGELLAEYDASAEGDSHVD